MIQASVPPDCGLFDCKQMGLQTFYRIPQTSSRKIADDIRGDCIQQELLIMSVKQHNPPPRNTDRINANIASPAFRCAEFLVGGVLHFCC